MAYLLLWIEGLTATVLVVATIAALAGRCKSSLWRRLWPLLAAVVQFLVIAAVTVLAGFLLARNIKPTWLFAYSLAFTIIYILVAGFLLRRSFKSRDQEPAAKAWPRARLAVALGLVMTIWLVTFYLLDVNRQIELANVRIETAGKALTILPPRPLHHEDATKLYEMSAEALGDRGKLPNWLYRVDVPNFDPTTAEVNDFLQEKAPVMALLQQATARPGYYFYFDISNLTSSPVPELAPFRNLAKYLVLDAKSKALDGDTRGAMKALSAIKRIAEHLRRMPILITYMVSVGVDKIATRGLEFVLAHTLTPQDISPWPSDNTHSREVCFVDAFRLEEVIALQGISLIEYSYKKDRVLPCVFLPLLRVFLMPSDVATMRQKQNEIFKILAKPYHEFQQHFQAWKKSNAETPGGFYSSRHFSHHHWAYRARAVESDAIQGLENLALAASAYKASHGEYPARLEELVPAYIKRTPTDPFDGKPLKMKPVEGGICLFSTGLDYKKGPINFYLGRDAYEKYRVKPVQ